MEREGQRQSREQAGKVNGTAVREAGHAPGNNLHPGRENGTAARESGHAPGNHVQPARERRPGREAPREHGGTPGVQGLREYIGRDGRPTDSAAVAGLREFIHHRIAEHGNPQKLDENTMIRNAVVQAHGLMERAQQRAIMRGVELPAAMAMRAGIINQTQGSSERQPYGSSRNGNGRANGNGRRKA